MALYQRATRGIQNPPVTKEQVVEERGGNLFLILWAPSARFPTETSQILTKMPRPEAQSNIEGGTSIPRSFPTPALPRGSFGTSPIPATPCRAAHTTVGSHWRCLESSLSCFATRPLCLRSGRICASCSLVFAIRVNQNTLPSWR